MTCSTSAVAAPCASNSSRSAASALSFAFALAAAPVWTVAARRTRVLARLAGRFLTKIAVTTYPVGNLAPIITSSFQAARRNPIASTYCFFSVRSSWPSNNGITRFTLTASTAWMARLKTGLSPGPSTSLPIRRNGGTLSGKTPGSGRRSARTSPLTRRA